VASAGIADVAIVLDNRAYLYEEQMFVKQV
jgi:hypothetical protein